MSEARSMTPLSENDYEAISEAVMETARGRWFMTEFARRNRQADTSQLLTAIGRIERAVGAASGELPPPVDPIWREAAALIADLRIDLERISGRTQREPSGLAERIETSASQILGATELIQEGAWRLRETGGNDEFCDLLDRRTTEIFASTAIIEGTARQIGKIADTIAMLDSSLRVFADRTVVDIDTDDLQQVTWSDCAFDAQPAPSHRDMTDFSFGEPGGNGQEQHTGLSTAPVLERRIGSIHSVGDDLVFEDMIDPEAVPPESVETMATAIAASPAFEALPQPPIAPLPAATSEADLYALDALPADQKLAYFA